MPKSVLRFVLLMLIMLNHDVSACESIVMHLPDENHPFSVLDNSDHQDMPVHQHGHSQSGIQFDAAQTAASASDSSADDNHHPTHAHVACYIAELFSVSATPAVTKASALAQYAVITTSYTPLVPPPNA